jgi:hypothetical protein
MGEEDKFEASRQLRGCLPSIHSILLVAALGMTGRTLGMGYTAVLDPQVRFSFPLLLPQTIPLDCLQLYLD